MMLKKKRIYNKTYTINDRCQQIVEIVLINTFD